MVDSRLSVRDSIGQNGHVVGSSILLHKTRIAFQSGLSGLLLQALDLLASVTHGL